MKTYLEKTKHNTFRYVRRVPQDLLEFTPNNRFRVSLGSNQLEATQIALSFNNAIEEALQLISLGVERDMIISKLDGLISKDRVEETTREILQQGLFLTTVSEYIASQVDNISADETRDKGYFYNEVCCSIFKEIGLTDNPVHTDINYNDLLQFRDIIVQLPKRNIQKYRDMPMTQILKSLKEIQETDRISARTVNKYIKWLRALFNFAVVLNHLQVNLANSLSLQRTIDDKLQRLPLKRLELELLLKSVPHKMQYLLKVLAYTGMRLSELYKCKVEEVDGIMCFTLMDRSIKLKTKSSYRVIPIHTTLLVDITSFEELRCKVSSNNLAKTTSTTIKKLGFKDKEKKSLYSLRHKFATQLIQKNANASIVSELMGHAHSTMTMNRYVKGYPIEVLKEVIDKL